MGFENTVHLLNGALALSKAEPVDRAVATARGLGQRPTSAAETRLQLGLAHG